MASTPHADHIVSEGIRAKETLCQLTVRSESQINQVEKWISDWNPVVYETLRDLWLGEKKAKAAVLQELGYVEFKSSEKSKNFISQHQPLDKVLYLILHDGECAVHVKLGYISPKYFDTPSTTETLMKKVSAIGQLSRKRSSTSFNKRSTSGVSSSRGNGAFDVLANVLSENVTHELQCLRAGHLVGETEILFGFTRYITSVSSASRIKAETTIAMLTIPIKVYREYFEARRYSQKVSQNVVDEMSKCHVFRNLRLSHKALLASVSEELFVPKSDFAYKAATAPHPFILQSGRAKVTMILNSSGQRRGSIIDGDSEMEKDLGRTSTMECREITLRFLSPYDVSGLLPVVLNLPASRFDCIASEVSNVIRMDALTMMVIMNNHPPFAISVLSDLHVVRDWFTSRIRNSRKKRSIPITLAIQCKGPIPCSRCGHRGHTSTSASCAFSERKESVPFVPILPLLRKQTSPLRQKVEKKGDGCDIASVTETVEPKQTSKQRSTTLAQLMAKMDAAIGGTKTRKSVVKPKTAVAPTTPKPKSGRSPKKGKVCNTAN